jgi:hypothetical protein
VPAGVSERRVYARDAGLVADLLTQEMVPAPVGPYLSSFTDTFDDNVVDPVNWSGSYGTYSETGGRARVGCTTDYSGYNSRYGWAFDSLLVNIPVLAAQAGAVADCYTGIWVASDAQDAGTHVGFVFNRTVNELRMEMRTGYYDASAVGITIDTVAQAWIRLRLDGPTLLWDTSPDGTNWFTQRTTTAPAWLLTAERCKLLLEARRDAGTSNFSEFDNLNLAPSSGAVVAGLATAALGALSATAVGVRQTPGATAATLGGLSATAVGLRSVAGTTAVTFGALAATAAGARTVAGVTSLVLGGLTATAAGARTAAGSSTTDLGALAATAAGTVTRLGAATADLGGLTAAAAGTSAPTERNTPRPSSGVTARPSTTVTARPLAGTTARP